MDLTSEERFLKNIYINEDLTSKTKEELFQLYEHWATTYEQDYEDTLGCEVHSRVADNLCDIIPEESRGKVKVLDAGAGTGLLSTQLKGRGFVQIDAIEPSPKMLEEARKKKSYQTYLCEYITGEPLNIEKGTYDVVIGIGMLGANHAPFSALREMARLTKSGGHVILSLRRWLVEQREEYRTLEPLMRQMEEEGHWRMVTRYIHPGYYRNIDGIIYIFRVL